MLKFALDSYLSIILGEVLNMKYKKIIISAMILALSVSTLFNIVGSVAANNEPGPKVGDRSIYISPEEQIRNLLKNPNLSSEKKKQAYQKYLQFEKFNNGEYFAERSYGSNVMNVPWCPQENNYYCGPASVQQVLQYLNGYSPSQDSLASSMNTNADYGTDNAQIVDYLNAHTNKTYEARWWWKDKTVLEHMVVYGTDHNDQPIVAYIQIPTKNSIDSWPYYTSGHYLVYNGYSNGGRTIHVTDPFAHRAQYNKHRISDGKYTVESWEAEKVTRRVNW